MTERGEVMTERDKKGEELCGLTLLYLGGGNRDCHAPINQCSQ